MFNPKETIKRVKKRLLKYLDKLILLLHKRRDYYIEFKRLPNAESIFDNIKWYKGDLIKFHELKKICKFLALNNKLEKYNEVLMKFIPQWNLSQASFVFLSQSHGNGGENFNIYRIANIEGGQYFEKIYYSDSNSLKRNIWFLEKFFPLLGSQINAPLVRFDFKGKIIHALYFDYLKTHKLDDDSVIEEQMLYFTKFFYQSSIKDEAKDIIIDAPYYIKEYKDIFFYMNNITDYNQYLVKNEIDSESIGKRITHLKKIFTHGDITARNIMSNNTLIDWDEFGLKPIGLDVAYVFYLLKIQYNFYSTIKVYDWLEVNYKDVILPVDWKDFRLGFSYFLSMFSFRHFEKGRYKDLEKELLIYLNTIQNSEIE